MISSEHSLVVYLAIVRALRAARATILVVGVRPKRRSRWFGTSSPNLDLAVEVMRLVDGVDIHLVKVTGTASNMRSTVSDPE